uniref:Uncharacterized protein n=1 Tax=Anguilla anguilla TaxID=7936 RepID=A0A0E9WW52_ANGAN
MVDSGDSVIHCATNTIFYQARNVFGSITIFLSGVRLSSNVVSPTSSNPIRVHTPKLRRPD